MLFSVEQAFRVRGEDAEVDVVPRPEDDASVVRFLVGVPAVQELGVVEVELDFVGRERLLREVVPDGVEAGLQLMSDVAEEVHDASVEVGVGVEYATEVREDEGGVLGVVELFEEVLHVCAGPEFAGDGVLPELSVRHAVLVHVGVESGDGGAGRGDLGRNLVHVIEPEGGGGRQVGAVGIEVAVLGDGAVDIVKGEVLGRLEDLADPFSVALVSFAVFFRVGFRDGFLEAALSRFPVAEHRVGVVAETLRVDMDGGGVPGRAFRLVESGEDLFEAEGRQDGLPVVGDGRGEP